MTPLTRYLMIGGFLGAGKTTAIARLARHYLDRGRQVGLVTNDQAEDLVDTHALQAQGFRVGEVPGACFCCSFDQLIDTLADLRRDEVPDIVIAEPVGSCTDLVATVIEPMKRFHADQYQVGPLAVLLKPEHGRKILRREMKAGFSPKAAYIFLKQIEEADIVAVNKIDKLSGAESAELIQLVRDQFPHKQVVAVSARRGDNFETLVSWLESPGPQRRQPMEVDYDTYADGEAELGWLNCRLQAFRDAGGGRFSLDRLVHHMVAALGQQFTAAHAEAAHVKVFGQFQQVVAIGNLVAGGVEAELSCASGVEVPHAELVLNARVATDPSHLETMVRDTLAGLASAESLQLEVGPLRCFRPGRPVPTYRF